MKLHLGCGKRRLSGFTHVDLGPHDHIDLRQDIRLLPTIPDGSVEIIYASHVFMYFTRAEAREVLWEWRRVLRPEGILRLAVPDFEALVAVYEKSKDLDQIIGQMFNSWSIPDACPGSREAVFPKTIYDFKGLASLLLRAGFRRPQRWDWKSVFVGEHAGFDDYSRAYIPHMDETGILTSLNIEAIK